MFQSAVLERSLCPNVVARVKVAMPAARNTVACSSCCLQGVCLPCNLEAGDLDRFGEIAAAKRKVARGAALYRPGEAFESLYAVRSGAFKTVGVSHDGEEKVTGFYLSGELLGLDSISSGRHGYSAVD